MENMNLWLIPVMAALHVALLILVVRRLSKNEIYTEAQKRYQALAAAMVPFLGSVIVLLMLKPDRPSEGKSDFPPAPGPNPNAVSGATSINHLP